MLEPLNGPRGAIARKFCPSAKCSCPDELLSVFSLSRKLSQFSQVFQCMNRFSLEMENVCNKEKRVGDSFRLFLRFGQPESSLGCFQGVLAPADKPLNSSELALSSDPLIAERRS